MGNPDLEKVIERYAKLYSYPAKYSFGSPGETMEGIYYIKEGRTTHYMLNYDGIEKNLYTLTKGWFFGETPHLLNTKTGLYSRTEVPSQLYQIKHENVNYLLDNNHLFRQAVLQCQANKLLILRCEIENLCFNTCKERLLRILYASVDLENSIDPQWYDLKMRYTHLQLGEMIGAARVTISKLIQKLCDENFIRILNRKIQVNSQYYEKNQTVGEPTWYRG